MVAGAPLTTVLAAPLVFQSSEAAFNWITSRKHLRYDSALKRSSLPFLSTSLSFALAG